MPEADDLTRRAGFGNWGHDVARYGDTDRQGHINNVAIARYSETGRVAFLWDHLGGPPEGCQWVIARLEIDFRAEMHWGVEVEIGNRVLGIGRSSLRLGQGIFQGGSCCAIAMQVMVLVDAATGRATGLPDELRARLLAG